MQFLNRPNLSITVPVGAGPGQAREVLGQDIPPELQAYYAGRFGGCTVIGALLFYTSAGDYAFFAYLVTNTGNYPSLGIGDTVAGTVRGKIFILGGDPATTLQPPAMIDTVWQDANGSQRPWTVCTYHNGWSGRSGFTTLQFKRNFAPDSTVQLSGQITGGTKTDGTVVATITDSRCWPLRQQAFPIGNIGSSGPIAEVQTNGDIKIFGLAAAGSADIQINAMFPIDI